MPFITGGHKVKIDLSNREIGTVVEIDGVQVKGLVCLELRHHAGEVSRIKLELLPSEVEVSGDASEIQRVEASHEDVRRMQSDRAARGLIAAFGRIGGGSE